MKLKAVLFDFIGKETNLSVIANCLSQALIEHGLFLNAGFFNTVGEKHNLVIINEVLNRYNLSTSASQPIYQSFKRNIEKNLKNFSYSTDTLILFSHLRRRGLLIGIGTGLPPEIFDIIFSHLGLTKKAFNYIGFYNIIEKNNDTQNLIADMMLKLGIKEPREILKVGNTVADIREGKKANCFTAVVLNGHHPKSQLIGEGPDYILSSLSDLFLVIDEIGRIKIGRNYCSLPGFGHLN